MKSAKAAFRSNKEPTESGQYTSNIYAKCKPSCSVKTGLSGTAYANKKNLQNIKICQLPFNKLNLNINLVTKNTFENECVIQNKSNDNCNAPMDPANVPYLTYVFYPYKSFYPNKSRLLCTLNNNNFNRVYYPVGKS